MSLIDNVVIQESSSETIEVFKVTVKCLTQTMSIPDSIFSSLEFLHAYSQYIPFITVLHTFLVENCFYLNDIYLLRFKPLKAFWICNLQSLEQCKFCSKKQCEHTNNNLVSTSSVGHIIYTFRVILFNTGF